MGEAGNSKASDPYYLIERDGGYWLKRTNGNGWVRISIRGSQLAEPLTIEELLLRGGASCKQARRAHQRLAMSGIKGEMLSGGASFACRLTNISIDGCCLQCESPFVDGALPHLEIVLSITGLALHIAGEIQWISRENVIGVRFLCLSAESKSLLAMLMTNPLNQLAPEAVAEPAAGDGSMLRC